MSLSELPVEGEELDVARGVLQVLDDEAVGEELDARDDGVRLRNDVLEGRLRLGIGRERLLVSREVDRHDPSARGVPVGRDVEDGPDVVDDLVMRVEVVEELHERRVRDREVADVDAVPGVGPFRDAEDEVPAVVGDGGAEAELRIVGPLVDEPILRLRRPEAVEDRASGS